MRLPAHFVTGARYPELHHGRGVSRGFFKGRCRKLLSADRSQRWAAILSSFHGLGTGDDSAERPATKPSSKSSTDSPAAPATTGCRSTSPGHPTANST